MILNYNGLKWLEPIYESIKAQQSANLVVYLVDNDSSDESLTLTRERYPHVRIIAMPKNLGYATAYNLATPIALDEGCDWVVWANNDILLMPDCISQMTAAALSDPAIGIVGPTCLEWQGERPNRYMRAIHRASLDAVEARNPRPIAVDWVEGSFLMISRQCFEATGPIDPIYVFYWEEADYCRRARRHGWKVVLAPAAVVRHYGGGTATAKAGRTRFAHLGLRNSYLYLLTDPDAEWALNWRRTLKHFVGRATRRRIPRPGELAAEVKAFAAMLAMTGTASRKWRRDRDLKPAPRCIGLTDKERAEIEARFGPVS